VLDGAARRVTAQAWWNEVVDRIKPFPQSPEELLKRMRQPSESQQSPAEMLAIIREGVTLAEMRKPRG